MKESIKMNDYLMELFKFTIGKGNKDLIYPLVKEGIVSEKSVVKTIMMLILKVKRRVSMLLS